MKILKGTIIGGLTYFILGWIIYGIFLMNFTSTYMNQCTARGANEMVWWAIILSNIINGLMLTLILNWSGAKKWLDGMKTGAIYGFLVVAGFDLSTWSMTTTFKTFWILLFDVGVATAMMAVTGILITIFCSKKKIE
jgi:hypothetical protein